MILQNMNKTSFKLQVLVLCIKDRLNCNLQQLQLFKLPADNKVASCFEKKDTKQIKLQIN